MPLNHFLAVPADDVPWDVVDLKAASKDAASIGEDPTTSRHMLHKLVGLKLEALDRKNPNLICVATIEA